MLSCTRLHACIPIYQYYNFRFFVYCNFFKKKILYSPFARSFYCLESGHETLTHRTKNNGQRGGGFCELSIERVCEQGSAVRGWREIERQNGDENGIKVAQEVDPVGYGRGVRAGGVVGGHRAGDILQPDVGSALQSDDDGSVQCQWRSDGRDGKYWNRQQRDAGHVLR